ncbi:hypothetical protein CEE37_09505 [candidate division LCP-89 bacterium B3_LCP]|uniref:Secretion system C-terminal sorting domain-containing protein n=1 Tax=candidate division LCP-89 bacterium B3_LCP TaxID=2012998 RepID=A0A532UYH7_UNCL8|nr:MAG: hypothetical protein CEE37_09505 [candidate division LCP-89 bacterium B3_LCP]
MKRSFSILALIILLSCSNIFAETITVSGDVSGTWSADTVLVVGEVRVPQEQTLTIEPGVEIIFQGHYKLIVDTLATLLAVGTEQDSILFTAADTSVGWHGVRFYASGDTSVFAYCLIKNGSAFENYIPYEDSHGGAIYLRSTDIHLHNCYLTQNRAERWGGGIYANDQSSITIQDCIFTENTCVNNSYTVRGGAIFADETMLNIHGSDFIENLLSGHGGTTSGGAIDCIEVELVVDNCIFLNNDAITVYANPNGGAIATSTSVARINNCYFEGNSAPDGSGGAIKCYGETVINNCMFFENSTWRGGGISCAGNTAIEGCIFSDNTTESWGGAIRSEYQANTSILNCTVSRNTTGGNDPGAICTGNYSSLDVKNAIVEGNVNGGIRINGLATINIDFCDIYNNTGGNISGNPPPMTTVFFEDPLFIDPDNRNFNIQAGSPCIDRGDPRLFDPDSTRSDIGVHYFDYTDRVRITGNCFLQNQIQHQGTRILFQANSGGAITDSSFTTSNSSYQVFIFPGIYDIFFTHIGYEDSSILNYNCGEPIVIPEVRLRYLPGSIHISGPISGLMETQTYFVDGDISVQEGDSLTIESGSILIFCGAYEFDVDGYLLAAGTMQDSIKFIPHEVVYGWEGIDFNNSASDNCKLEYCFIEGSLSSGIHCEDASPTIAHCSIANNLSDGYGAGIRCDYADPYIYECLIYQNSAIIGDGRGGGISCYYSYPLIENCILIGNNANSQGGGIYCGFSDPDINGCILSNNESLIMYGGGISCEFGSASINNSIFYGNNADLRGGGINTFHNDLTMNDCAISNNYVRGTNDWSGGGGLYLFQNEITISNCIISMNSAGTYGGGISCRQTDILVIDNCLVCFNSAEGAGSGIRCNANCRFHLNNSNVVDNLGQGSGLSFGSTSITANNVSSIFWGNEPEQISQNIYMPVNPLVTYSDVQDTLWPGIGNINEDPLFVNPALNDYRLQWGSPCIDSGDPSQYYNDPDSTRADMGAFYYDQSVPVRILLSPHEIPYLIEPEGGTMDYTIQGTNIYQSSHDVTIWCDVELPDSAIYGPVLGPVTITIEPGQTVERFRTQTVPAAAPMGVYHYNAYAVVDQDTSKDSFMFGKLGTIAGGSDSWGNAGDPLIEIGGGNTPALQETHVVVENYPNPFNVTTVISFSLPVASLVKLEVFDINGRNVGFGESDLQWYLPGTHQITFDGSGLASGIYIYHLTAGEFSASGKMVLMK